MINPLISLMLVGGAMVSVNSKDISYVIDKQCVRYIDGKDSPWTLVKSTERQVVACREVGLKSGKELDVVDSFDRVVTAMRYAK